MDWECGWTVGVFSVALGSELEPRDSLAQVCRHPSALLVALAHLLGRLGLGFRPTFSTGPHQTASEQRGNNFEGF